MYNMQMLLLNLLQTFIELEIRWCVSILFLIKFIKIRYIKLLLLKWILTFIEIKTWLYDICLIAIILFQLHSIVRYTFFYISRTFASFKHKHQ